VDQALPLKDTVALIAAWVAQIQLPDAPTCSWGEDRLYLRRESMRAGCADPFLNRAHVDLMEIAGVLLRYPSTKGPDRDDIRIALDLPDANLRHCALADALDLAPFCRALQKMIAGAIANPSEMEAYH